MWWPGEQAWFEGQIVFFRDGVHYVLYDDGDREAMVLAKERVRACVCVCVWLSL